MKFIDTDEDASAAAELSCVIRRFLRARHEPENVIASAIAYETAALFACHAPSEQSAFDVVDEWARVMKAQIRRMGIGIEYP